MSNEMIETLKYFAFKANLIRKYKKSDKETALYLKDKLTKIYGQDWICKVNSSRSDSMKPPSSISEVALSERYINFEFAGRDFTLYQKNKYVS